ncbi:hypothetical protein [Marinibacterium sp. SX1]|uniref:hypothetical protein n=1 Tax=Marinibacterium sp. SX1 TaxID=3388424 RepID=UPI003D16BFF5
MTGLTLLPAGAAALGLALLDGRIAPALWLSLRVGLGVAGWVGLWWGLGGWLAASGRMEALRSEGADALAVNAGLMLAAAILPALALAISARWHMTRPASLGAWHGLAWYGGLVLPQLGQAGDWPIASLVLATGAAATAMGLGALAGRGGA